MPMDMTGVLGLHKFSSHATIDHHGPSMYSGHHTTFINCYESMLLQWQQLTEFEKIDTSTAYVVIYKLIM